MTKRNQAMALGPIVVPTDFSPGAALALRRSAYLLPGRPAEIHIVHVVPARAPANKEIEADLARHLAQAVALVEKTSIDAGLETPAVTTSVRAGDAFVEIVRYARGVDADLIVLGRKGAGSGLRKVLGTTAARVVRMSDTPVLIVGERPRGAYRRPLVALALDSSERRLVSLVRAVCGASGNTVHGVHAYHVPFSGLLPPGSDASPSLHHRQVREQVAQMLEKHLEILNRAGTRVRATLRHGDARLAIRDEAMRRDADLIALGTHGRSGIAHALLGSVAEWVVMNTAKDVLIARPVRFTFKEP